MKIFGIIPSRFQSSRFPGKPLVDIAGKSMIQRVYEQAKKAKLLDDVVVATDDARILAHVQSFGGNVQLTATHHKNGTERCAETVKYFGENCIVINIQGDEPFIHPNQIDELAQLMKANHDIQIGTLVKKVDQQTDLANPNIVKVVFNCKLNVLYFSRSPIPFFRDLPSNEWCKQHNYYKHIGLYAYQKKVLEDITRLDKSELENAESLEQLRWLENGYNIRVGITDKETKGIDTPEDLLEIGQ